MKKIHFIRGSEPQDVYKLSVRRPFLCFSCTDFEHEVQKLDGPKANTSLPPSYEQEEVQMGFERR